jgi:hypothetical protein
VPVSRNSAGSIAATQAAASQEMRVYGDPDSLVIVDVARPFGTSTASATMTVSGYFVDVP